MTLTQSMTMAVLIYIAFVFPAMFAFRGYRRFRDKVMPDEIAEHTTFLSPDFYFWGIGFAWCLWGFFLWMVIDTVKYNVDQNGFYRMTPSISIPLGFAFFANSISFMYLSVVYSWINKKAKAKNIPRPFIASVFGLLLYLYCPILILLPRSSTQKKS